MGVELLVFLGLELFLGRRCNSNQFFLQHEFVCPGLRVRTTVLLKNVNSYSLDKSVPSFFCVLNVNVRFIFSVMLLVKFHSLQSFLNVYDTSGWIAGWITCIEFCTLCNWEESAFSAPLILNNIICNPGINSSEPRFILILLLFLLVYDSQKFSAHIAVTLFVQDKYIFSYTQCYRLKLVYNISLFVLLWKDDTIVKGSSQSNVTAETVINRWMQA